MVNRVVKLFNPVAIEFHQDQAGYIPNRCEHRCEYNAYWQLYKMKAVFRMMEKHEVLREQLYTWVVRSRLDIAWMLPMPPVSRFPLIRVTAGHNFFPLADQFLLVPRRFGSVVFGAVSLCYACSVLKKQVESGVPAQTESFLRLAMRQAGVPFGFYEFPVVIVRNNEGGVCGVLHPHNLLCQLLISGLLIDPAVKCADVVNRWQRNACREMFPPLTEDDEDIPTMPETREAARNRVDVKDAPGAVDRTHVQDGRTHRGWQGNPRTHSMGSSATERPGGSMSEVAAADTIIIANSENRTSNLLVVSFEESTRRQEGILEDLRRLREAIKVRAMPRQDRSNFFVAHHYPFHQTNGELRDAISTIACFRLSQEELNRVAIAFACSLSDVETGDIFKAKSGAVGEREPMPAENARDGDDGRNLERDPLLFVGKGDTEDNLRAVANCTLVEPLHDVWMNVLLSNEFEPSEPVCRGPVMPCFLKAVAESRF